MKKSNPEFHKKHSLGQNFISDPILLRELVEASGVGCEDNVLEIGPGTGVMTRILAERCKKVITLEVDERLLPILKITLEKAMNVSIVYGDVMKANLPEITSDFGVFHIVANIPYYITTPLLMLLLTSSLPILSINVMLQKEAAERVLAAPGTPGYGMLAIRTQYLMTPKITVNVPAKYFNPQPKVDSVFVVMKRRPAPSVEVRDIELMFRIASSAFSMRRKTLLNNLISSFNLSRDTAHEWIRSCGIKDNARGETLSLAQYALLSDKYPNMLIQSVNSLSIDA